VHIKGNGTLDRIWNPRPDGDVYAMAISGDRLYVGQRKTIAMYAPKGAASAGEKPAGPHPVTPVPVGEEGVEPDQPGPPAASGGACTLIIAQQ
jgi:hypothetical protein